MIEGFVGWVAVRARRASFLAIVKYEGTEYVRSVPLAEDDSGKIFLREYLPGDSCGIATGEKVIRIDPDTVVQVTWDPDITAIARRDGTYHLSQN